MKKFFKILGIVIIVLIIAVIAAPFLFQDQIAQAVKDKLNASMDAQIEFGDVDLSFIKAFPDARLNIEDLSIINKEPFAGDTLFFAQQTYLDMPLFDVFNKADEPIRINELIVNEAVMRLKVNEEEKANWDIASAKADSQQPQDTTTAGFTIDIKHYEITDSELSYEDVSTKNRLILTDLQHSGNGDFSLENSTLDTETSALVIYSLDDIEYLSGQRVQLDADILMDLDNQKYTLKDNKALVNDLELELQGFIDLEEESTIVDLTFNAPSSDFKNFFAIIPETYRSNLDGITTTGDFTVDGMIKGQVTDELIPMLDIKVKSDNASFQYPDLPQKVTNIYIDAQLINTTGKVDDTYLNIANTSFNIGKDRLQGNAMITQLTSNMNIDLNAKGNLDLGNLSQSFPLPEDMDLDGRLALDMAAQFDMESIEKERYERVRTNGTASLTDFKYIGTAFENPFLINRADLDLNTSTIKLNAFDAITGNTDINATGTINNLIGFLLQDQGLKGNFNLRSNNFDVADFMEETTEVASSNQTSTASTSEAVKIPAFLDAQLDFNLGQVRYDGLTLKNVKGIALVRDETLTLNNTSTDIFGGAIGVSGSVSTKGATPQFNMNLNMANLDIAQSFQGFEMFQQYVPIIQALQGKINTNIDIKGNLTDDLSPILTSINGDALAELLTKEISPNAAPLLAKLDEKLSFISLKDIDLSDLKTKLKFQDGAVQVSPFDFKIKDIVVTASGRHSLTNEMDYTMDLKVPARYLGKEGAALLSKLQDSEIANLTVPVPVRFSGSFAAPNVQVNLESAVTNLTNQIVEIQKQKLKDRGEDALGGAINDITSGKNPLIGIKDVLSGKKPTTTDTTAIKKPADSVTKPVVKDQAKETARNLLNGLLKKKKDTTRS
ncbi:AsmA-like C-terminal region [Nonlabens sp. Hel1_33_55]|uniref:AsmA-like C-terminal region-containing protein n=1 Tax=Nonlabens sp. Hel1_33_55 TaxID=1336802 RepID=UPI000875C1F3|nr:AsmA-like C-terminal region-containing protein [Nonlabens sp. Hel1_33_55]SCY30112.1 AsmA-like C-terminal region [Nonlabens sp. Hel1_33_55]